MCQTQLCSHVQWILLPDCITLWTTNKNNQMEAYQGTFELDWATSLCKPFFMRPRFNFTHRMLWQILMYLATSNQYYSNTITDYNTANNDRVIIWCWIDRAAISGYTYLIHCLWSTTSLYCITSSNSVSICTFTITPYALQIINKHYSVWRDPRWFKVC